MPIHTLFKEHYVDAIQLSLYQAQTIASCMMSRGPGCNALIFGVGNDTPLWLEACTGGTLKRRA